MRYQQVFAAREFLTLAPEGGVIDAMWFRVDGMSANATVDIPSIQINLSTTTRGPDQLSSIFADNVGLDDAVAFEVGPLHLDGATTSGALSPFSSLILLDTPFFYDPRQGNLLLDVRNFVPAPPRDFGIPSLDATREVGDSVSIVYSTSVTAEQGVLSSLGLITQFNIVFVPEPPPGVLLGLGAGVCALCWAFRRRRTGDAGAAGSEAYTGAPRLKPNREGDGDI